MFYPISCSRRSITSHSIHGKVSMSYHPHSWSEFQSHSMSVMSFEYINSILTQSTRCSSASFLWCTIHVQFHIDHIQYHDHDMHSPELQFISTFKAIITISSNWKSKIHVPIAFRSWKCNSHPDSYTLYMGKYKENQIYLQSIDGVQFIFRFIYIMFCHVISQTTLS